MKVSLIALAFVLASPAYAQFYFGVPPERGYSYERDDHDWRDRQEWRHRHHHHHGGCRVRPDGFTVCDFPGED